jgi:D-glycero-D-manno-heptose 1,7-bisphosphate phosphatase
VDGRAGEPDALRPQRAVFLDRDGTIIEDTGFVRRPEDVHFLPGAPDGLRLLQEKGYRLIVVSNQSGIARGLFDLSQLEAVHERFLSILAGIDVRLTDCFYCPYHPQGTVEQFRKESADRKGSPGMILKAAHRHGIFLAGSWMVGDRDDDIRAGQAGGTRTIRIGGNPADNSTLRPDFYADNLLSAATIITETGAGGVEGNDYGGRADARG